ncbi:MAG: aspartate:alanine exchanger family transporter [Deinococcales bacterium]
MPQELLDNPLFTLFVVSSLGFMLGKINFGGIRLGVAAVLFVGLGFGAAFPNNPLPEILQRFGLVLFVYTIGLSSGAGFVRSFAKRGWRDNLAVLAALCFATAVLVGIKNWLGLEPSVAAGLFAGALTNTPALAGVTEQLQGLPTARLPVLGYSVAYPMGVVAMLLVMVFLKKFWKVDLQQEASRAGVLQDGLSQTQVLIQQPSATQLPILSLAQQRGWKVIFARHTHAGQEHLVNAQTQLALGDSITITGKAADLEPVAQALGTVVPISLDRQNFDYRRMFVSKQNVAGRSISELGLQENFGALITRVRRGDQEFLAQPDTILELGDRVRVVAPKEMLPRIATFLGDSLQRISEVDVLSFGLGIALGLILGSLSLPLPNGEHFELGIATGVLVMGLVLGWRERSFGMLWQIPYSANLTIRQLGLVLFLACVGTRSGDAFFQTIFSSLGLQIFICGALLTSLTALSLMWWLYKVQKMPFPIALGVLSGLQTQPALLGFALEQTRNELPNQGYSTVYPLAMLAKIFLAQWLLFW